ncbi:MAG: ParB/RepB/Spo0J family partition protein [Pseudomonadota bacterium]
MSEVVALISTSLIEPNPENPRLIFHEDELETLSQSISKQGILVPLTVYQEGRKYKILDGERRWRCSLRLGLTAVPVIVQPKPDRMTNLMMMFAIHNARRDWDPLPTALKLEQLEKEFVKRHGHIPTETEISGIASLPRGEVRRLKKLLSLPIHYREELLAELEKPRSQQALTVDHVIETTAGVEALQKRKIISESEAEPLRQAIIQKFRSKIIDNTVAPRKLANLARAVEREEVSIATARKSVLKLQTKPEYTIQNVYEETVEQSDLEHGVDQLASRLMLKLEELTAREVDLSPKTVDVLRRLARAISRHA